MPGVKKMTTRPLPSMSVSAPKLVVSIANPSVSNDAPKAVNSASVYPPGGEVVSMSTIVRGSTATTRAPCNTAASVQVFPLRLALSCTIEPTEGVDARPVICVRGPRRGARRADCAREANPAPPTSWRSRWRNAPSIWRPRAARLIDSVAPPTGASDGVVVTALVPVDASVTSVVLDGIFELLNGIITYSDAVPSPPTHSDATSAALIG